MKATTTRRWLFAVGLASMVTGSVMAQNYNDDDIYFDSSKPAKVKAEKPKAQKQNRVTTITTNAPTVVYTGSDRSVDEYNRRGNYKPVKEEEVDLGDNFKRTRQIERFSNPDIVINSDDDDLLYLYTNANDELANVNGYSSPTTVNIYVDNTDPWDSFWNPYYYSSAWSWAYRPAYYNPWWSYNYAWGYGPSWSWNWGWGPSISIGWNWGWNSGWNWGWSWGWNPGWGWGGPCWGPGWGGWHRPGHWAGIGASGTPGRRPYANHNYHNNGGPGRRPVGNYNGNYGGNNNRRPAGSVGSGRRPSSGIASSGSNSGTRPSGGLYNPSNSSRPGQQQTVGSGVSRGGSRQSTISADRFNRTASGLNSGTRVTNNNRVTTGSRTSGTRLSGSTNGAAGTRDGYNSSNRVNNNNNRVSNSAVRGTTSGTRSYNTSRSQTTGTRYQSSGSSYTPSRSSSSGSSYTPSRSYSSPSRSSFGSGSFGGSRSSGGGYSGGGRSGGGRSGRH